jgi:CheY-like chemotaxis protein
MKGFLLLVLEKKLTVLVVEDEWLVRQTLADFLDASDCVVVEAESGEAAIAMLQRSDGIDVVLTDLRLGGTMNGWDVGEASREHDATLPVIYMSAAVIRPERPVPGSLFFAKPYDPSAVLDACRSLCAARRPN